MKKSDFVKITKKGFSIDVEEYNESVRCFVCNAHSKLERTEGRGRPYRMVCENGHKSYTITWLYKQIDMRDGVTKVFLNKSCSFSWAVILKEFSSCCLGDDESS